MFFKNVEWLCLLWTDMMRAGSLRMGLLIQAQMKLPSKMGSQVPANKSTFQPARQLKRIMPPPLPAHQRHSTEVKRAISTCTVLART